MPFLKLATRWRASCDWGQWPIAGGLHPAEIETGCEARGGMSEGQRRADPVARHGGAPSVAIGRVGKGGVQRQLDPVFQAVSHQVPRHATRATTPVARTWRCENPARYCSDTGRPSAGRARGQHIEQRVVAAHADGHGGFHQVMLKVREEGRVISTLPLRTRAAQHRQISRRRARACGQQEVKPGHQRGSAPMAA